MRIKVSRDVMKAKRGVIGDSRTYFRCDFAIFVKLRFDMFVEIVEERWDDYDGSDKDADKCKTLLAQIELIDSDEYYGERFEPYVEDAVNEPDVEI